MIKFTEEPDVVKYLIFNIMSGFFGVFSKTGCVEDVFHPGKFAILTTIGNQCHDRLNREVPVTGGAGDRLENNRKQSSV